MSSPPDTLRAEPAIASRFEQTVATARLIAEGAEMRSLTRRRVRSVVERIDEAIAACERAHLERRRDVGRDLAAQAEGVVAEVSSLGANGIDVLGGVRVEGPLPTRVIDLMDRLWLLQERMFDVLAPSRRDLTAGDDRTGR
jgi:hypothetical protein